MKPGSICVIAIVALSGAFLAGSEWTNRNWKIKWAERDSTESSQVANA
ncbi:DUF2514 family protein, partial [Salmonella enterica]|nr:DUF2514 family protein [Salmonella enterica]